MTRGPITARSGVFSVYEAQQRMAVASKLVDFIDARVTSQGRDPFADAATVARDVRSANLGHWIALALHAGVNTPSDVTVELVAKIYEHRAAALREVG